MSAGYEITINGETHSVTGWCKIYNINTSTVSSRVKAGMTYEEAFTTPIHYRHEVKYPKKAGKKVKQPHYGYKMKRTERCRRCNYGERADSQWVCMYMDLHPLHKRRPCPAGDECTVWEPKSKRLTDAQKEFFKSYVYGGKHV